MISIGGLDINIPFPKIFYDPDPLKNGLGVFDLTDLVWRDSYDAKAKAYQSPKVVRDWYAQGGMASVPWSSDAVKDLFAEAAPPDVLSPEPSDAPSSGPSPAPSVPTITGSVIGGVAGFFGIIGVFVFVRKRKRDNKPLLMFMQKLRRKRKRLTHGGLSDKELAVGSPPKEGAVGVSPKEMEAAVPLKELGPSLCCEMPSGHGLSELSTPEARGQVPPDRADELSNPPSLG